jgi:ribosomal protein S10
MEGVLRAGGESRRMPFVTTLRLTSGDRRVLDSVVTDIKTAAARKGAEFKGPHPKPPTELRVPQYADLGPGDTFDPWNYAVYARVVEIVGHDAFAREITQRDFPDAVHVAADIEQVRTAGDG